MADFDVTAANALFAALLSSAKKLGGTFKTTTAHEPKSAPTSFPSQALWLAKIAPASSGMASVSGVVTFNWRIYQAEMKQEPQDGIDPGLLKNIALVLRALAGGFTLGGTVRAIDLLGMYGQPLEATTGFITHDQRLLRVGQIIVPVIVNDMWSEIA